MAKYIVNPMLVKMQESKRGDLYQSIVAMGQRSRQINDDIRYELRYRMQDVIPQNDDENEITDNSDRITISKEFERLPKPTFIAMKEMYEDKLKFFKNLPEEDNGQIVLGF